MEVNDARTGGARGYMQMFISYVYFIGLAESIAAPRIDT
jgi:hypothetical protein